MHFRLPRELEQGFRIERYTAFILRSQNLAHPPLRNKVTEEKVVGTGTRVVGPLLVDEGRFSYKGQAGCQEKSSSMYSMFINKEGMLALLCRIQIEGYEWSCETTAQRD